MPSRAYAWVSAASIMGGRTVIMPSRLIWQPKSITRIYTSIPCMAHRTDTLDAMAVGARYRYCTYSPSQWEVSCQLQQIGKYVMRSTILLWEEQLPVMQSAVLLPAYSLSRASDPFYDVQLL